MSEGVGFLSIRTLMESLVSIPTDFFSVFFVFVFFLNYI